MKYLNRNKPNTLNAFYLPYRLALNPSYPHNLKMRILWKYKLQVKKTADSVLRSLFMRATSHMKLGH